MHLSYFTKCFTLCYKENSYISFWMNSITDLTPLVDNESFADGCSAHFEYNPIDCDDQAANIATLKNRGVHLVCDCDECGL